MNIITNIMKWLFVFVWVAVLWFFFFAAYDELKNPTSVTCDWGCAEKSNK